VIIDLSAVTTSDVQKKLVRHPLISNLVVQLSQTHFLLAHAYVLLRQKEKFSLKDDVVAAHQKQLEEIISKAITAAK